MCTVEPKQYRGGGGYYCPSGQIVYILLPNGQLVLEGVGNNVSEVGTWGLSNDGNTLYIRDVRGSGSYNYTTFRYEGRKYEYWGHTNGRNTLSVF